VTTLLELAFDMVTKLVYSHRLRLQDQNHISLAESHLENNLHGQIRQSNLFHLTYQITLMSRHDHVGCKALFLNVNLVEDMFSFHFKHVNASYGHAFYCAWFRNLLQIFIHFRIRFLYFKFIFNNMVIKVRQIFFLDFFN